MAPSEQAWKALANVNDWVKQADVKMGASLVSAGAAGTILYTLISNRTDPSTALLWAAGVCAAAVLSAGACAAVGLLPRLRPHRRGGPTPSNLFFFDSVARHYRDDSDGYVDALLSLAGDEENLARQAAQQVHANSCVASRKHRWAQRSLGLLVVGLLALAAVAGVLTLQVIAVC